MVSQKSIIFFLIISLSSLASWGLALTQSEIKPLYDLRELLVLGKQSSALFLSARRVVGLTDATFIVSDDLEYKLKKFDRKGNLATEIGKRGRNPGEFLDPSCLAVHENIIAVADLAMTRVQLFTSDFQYKSTFHARGLVLDMCFDRDGNLWIGIFSMRKEPILVKVDLNGKVLQTISLKNRSNDDLENIFSFDINNSGTIVVAFLFRNKVEIWNLGGEFVRDFTIPGLPLNPHKRKMPRNIFSGKLDEPPKDKFFRSIAVDSRGNIFLLADEFTSYPDQDVYIVDNNGTLSEILMLPFRTSYLSIDSHDRLLTIDESRALVRIYQLQHNPSRRSASKPQK
jgi:hypothetical protein